VRQMRFWRHGVLGILLFAAVCAVVLHFGIVRYLDDPRRYEGDAEQRSAAYGFAMVHTLFYAGLGFLGHAAVLARRWPGLRARGARRLLALQAAAAVPSSAALLLGGVLGFTLAAPVATWAVYALDAALRAHALGRSDAAAG
jgi:hypothetical protein